MNEKIASQENFDDGITLVELFNAIKQNILLLLAICVAVVVLGVIYTWFMTTPMYTSSIDIQISNVNENVSTVNQIRDNVKEAVKYQEIVEEALRNMEYPIGSDSSIESVANSIKKRVSSSNIGSASAVRVSYEDKDPVMATKIVKAIAYEAAKRVNIPKGTEGSLAYSSETLTILNIPRENPYQAPTSPNKMLNLAISVILGGIIGVVIVILKEQFSSYFKTKKEVEKFTKISVIAMIPAREGVKYGE